eukprot:5933687-Amphidinium_carterae.1
MLEAGVHIGDRHHLTQKALHLRQCSAGLVGFASLLSLEVVVKPGWKAGMSVLCPGEGSEIGQSGKAML